MCLKNEVTVSDFAIYCYMERNEGSKILLNTDRKIILLKP